MYLEYNNVALSDFLKIYKVEETLGSSRKNNSINISNMDGEIYTGYTKQPKKIKFYYDIKQYTDSEYEDILDSLAFTLDTKEEAKLIFNNEDRYYWAVPDGDVGKNRITKGMGEGYISFVCYNPYAYSKRVNLFEGDVDNVVTIRNGATKSTYPTVNVTFSQDAHFAQITNYDGKTVLVGNRPSVDNESIVPNTLVLHDKCEETTNWLPAGNVLDSDVDRLVEGNVTISKDGNYIVPSNFGNTIDRKWHGPAVRRSLGKNIENFKLTARIKHNSLQEGQSSGGSSSSNYKVTASSLNFRSGPGTNYKVICGIPRNTQINITSISKGWGKTRYKNKDGYVSMSYVSKVTSKASTLSVENKSNVLSSSVKTENKMLRLELYLFDQNSQKLGKIILRDSEEFYEYTQPEIYVGNKLVLEDKKSCPAAKTKTEKDSSGKAVTTKIESGRFGDWNEYYGDVTIERSTKNNKQYWSISVTKIKNGKTLNSPKLETKTALCSTDFPTGTLNHVVLWFGQYKDKSPCDDVGLTDLKVWDMNENIENFNVINFNEGDELEVDMGASIARVNGVECPELVDIGSQFFDSPVGGSQFIVKSDDVGIYTNAVTEERWI